MEIDAWVHFFGQVDPKTQNAVVGSLTSAGITTKTLDPEAPKGTGVVFFGDLNQGLSTFLREVSITDETGCWPSQSLLLR